MNDPRGSLWRRWDFHFHTPASYDHKAKGTINEECVEALVRAKVAAVVVSDHHRIDPDRFENLRRLGGGRITFFPGIELRSELGGKGSVHYIGIFPEHSNVRDLWTSLQGRLKLTSTEIESRGGDDRIYTHIDEGALCIHEYGGLVTIHAGDKANSIETICNDPLFKRQLKEDLLRKYVDILEVGKPKHAGRYHDIVFKKLNLRLPIVLGSDNHDIGTYDPSALCWIKADPTFEGLKMVLHEPEGRVFFGDEPKSRARVRKNRSKYISKIEIRKRPGSSLNEDWFDLKVPLNHELVAVIGNKGSGKSALADVIGLLGESKNHNSFSFLHRDRFRQPKDNKAAHFNATITWVTGTGAERNLDDTLQAGLIESVRYLPQSFLEKLCNELATSDGGQFSEELRAVVFSHVNPADRLGCACLEDLIKFKTSETARAIQQHREQLGTAVDQWVSLRKQQTSVHCVILEQHRDAKIRELSDHEAARPAKVEKPLPSPEEQQRIADIESEIDKLKVADLAIAQQITEAEELLGKVRIKQERANQLVQRLANAKSYFDGILEECRDDCELLGIDVGEVISLTTDNAQVAEAQQGAAKEAGRLAALLDEGDDGLPSQRRAIAGQITAQEQLLDAPNKSFQEYARAEEEWQQKRRDIIGNATTPDTLDYFRARLRELVELPKKIEVAKAACAAVATDIYREIAKEAEVYRSLYRPVQNFIEQHELAKEHFQLEFEAAIIESGFCESFFNHINQSKKGTFHGVADGNRKVRDLTEKARFDTSEGLAQFLTEVMRCLENDLRQSPVSPTKIEEQLKKESSVEHLLRVVFGLEYLRPHYILRWGGKDIGQLSPGERGTLLLVFYLLIDKSDIPLILDQPEENLDNQTVFDVLVPSIKEAKRSRQIILVTHNPNLAVVCDADQIVFSSIDKKNGNKVAYTTGSIESPAINRCVVNVLEGTWPAFDNRRSKYHPA